MMDDLEQKMFEKWYRRVCPSGGCESVHSQWLDSPDYEQFLFLDEGWCAIDESLKQHNIVQFPAHPATLHEKACDDVAKEIS